MDYSQVAHIGKLSKIHDHVIGIVTPVLSNWTWQFCLVCSMLTELGVDDHT